MASSATALLRLPATASATYRCETPTIRIPPTALPSRRRAALILLAAPFAAPLAASAVDVPLFGIRKKLERIEEEAVEAVREGERAVEKGIAAAEREVVEAEREVVAVEEEILGSGGAAQAAVVAAAEAVGVVVGVSVVNGILGAEAQRS